MVDDSSKSPGVITGFTKFRKSQGYTRDEVVNELSAFTMERLTRLEEGFAAANGFELAMLSTMYNVDKQDLLKFYKN